MRLHDWSGFAALAAVVFVLVELIRGELAIALAGVAAGRGDGSGHPLLERDPSRSDAAPAALELARPARKRPHPATRVVFRIPMLPSTRRTSSGCSARSLIPTLRWSSSAAFSSRRDAS